MNRYVYSQQVTNLIPQEDATHDIVHSLTSNIDILSKLSTIASQSDNRLLKEYLKFYIDKTTKQIMIAVGYGADPIKAMDQHLNTIQTAEQIQAQEIINNYYDNTGRTTPRPDFIVDHVLNQRIRAGFPDKKNERQVLGQLDQGGGFPPNEGGPGFGPDLNTDSSAPSDRPDDDDDRIRRVADEAKEEESEEAGNAAHHPIFLEGPDVDSIQQQLENRLPTIRWDQIRRATQEEREQMPNPLLVNQRRRQFDDAIEDIIEDPFEPPEERKQRRSRSRTQDREPKMSLKFTRENKEQLETILAVGLNRLGNADIQSNAEDLATLWVVLDAAKNEKQLTAQGRKAQITKFKTKLLNPELSGQQMDKLTTLVENNLELLQTLLQPEQ